MRFIEDIYVSPSLYKNEKSKIHILNKLKAGDFSKSFYVEYINKNTGKPEIMHSLFFMQKYLQTCDILVTAIFKTKDEAVNDLAKYVTGEMKVALLDID